MDYGTSFGRITMTDWYFGHDEGDFVVLKDQEYFDRLPSPDSWMQWETCGIGGNSGWENTFDSGNIANVKPQQRMLFGRPGNKEVNQADGEHSHDSSEFGGSSENSQSFLRNSAASARPDYYFNDLTGTDPEDDMFLYRSSLLQDDVLPLQSLYIDMPSDSDSMNKMMDFQSDSCDTDGVGSLKGFNNPNFSYSHGSVNGHVHPDKLNSRHNSGQTCGPSSIKVLETRDLDPSDYETSRTLEFNDLSSVEESVLMGLETVLNQLNDNTRLCLRDSIYRLAKHSEEQASKNSMAEGFSFDESSLPQTSDHSRSSTMETGESKSNAIDRAVAYLMFSKADTNVQDHLPASPPEYMQSGRKFAATGACGFNEAAGSKTSDLLAQCEVPVFSHQTQDQSNQLCFGGQNTY
ncbi:protein LNK4 isoform X1 [Beta vulgaris subsp. vulgaris]|uniref:protein LNK4 isoform X1 n=2 Tax=Beta vulgaris subsp. vulgaris TaxID=3555 RepID=UPI0020370693|nr:protein LNK4 isoform X1 [Beta vulgaris subsp. vulgaris]